MTNRSRTGPESDDWRGMTPSDRGLTTPMVDNVFALLADWRRRAVCQYFTTTRSNSVEVEDLAVDVARRVPCEELEGDETCEEAIRQSLVDDHLPRLDEAGVLDFDTRSNSVHYWGHPTLEKWAEHAQAVTER